MIALPPLAETASAAARAAFGASPPAPPASLTERRAADTANQAKISAAQQARYGLTVTDDTISGVPVRRFRLRDKPPHPGRLMLALHGGGFVLGTDSAENVPLAAMTGVEVVSVLYRLAPKHPFPAAVEDVIAVYRALTQTNPPPRIALYGTSAGAILATQAIARMVQESLPTPYVLGFFSGSSDMSRGGDSWQVFGPRRDGGSAPPVDFPTAFAAYLDGRDPKDPAVSPLFGDLAAFPPTLCVSGTRDFLLSQTVIFASALARAGVAVQQAIFEAMPHTHWGDPDLPESQEAFAIMAAFLGHHLGVTPRRAANAQ